MARDRDEVLEWRCGPKALKGFMGALRDGFTVGNPAGGRWTI